ncbi:MAG: hypothetical protein ABSD03_17660 [Vulcanimicrobiaceae bacterium]|jgi:hypothetical protein
MSRLLDVLVRNGVSENVANAVDAGYESAKESPADYLERLSTALWDAGGEFSMRSRQDTAERERA